MSVEWKDAVAAVAKVAPAVASALGSPVAGGIAAGAASMVTGLLGIENTAEGVLAATQNPEKRAELIRINNEHQRELEKLRIEGEMAQAQEYTKRLAETQKTMRAELESESTYRAGWRPFGGWVLMGCFALLDLAMVFAIGTDPAIVGDPEFTGLLIWLIVAQGALQGVNIKKRSDDKALAVGERPRSFMDAIRGK
ncbi:3TM-type holin [Halomonas sp. B23F22_10]|uniref:3TM-type holin n=1 Tax=Halomonas sp. B23F22_10 TaxID=3459515 RepID=UPI00373FBDC9